MGYHLFGVGLEAGCKRILRPFATIIAALTIQACPAAADDARQMPATAKPIADKTLVAWVGLSNKDQQGGSALTLMDGEAFDAIVFGERQPGRWMAGSDFFRRTQDAGEQAANPAETAPSGTLTQVVITYAGNRVSIFRNGRPYAGYAISRAREFGIGTMVLLGLRYCGENGETGFLSGAIEDARIYDTALREDQIAALQPGKLSDPPPLAWWTFADGKAEDVMKAFPATRLEGNARVTDGKLILDGDSYMSAARDWKQLAGNATSEEMLDRSVQTLFYKARSKLTGNMWDTWLYLADGEYFLYYLAKARGQWDNISLARSPDGVHWQETGRVLSKTRGATWMGTGSIWRSPDFASDGRYIMNFSEWTGPRQNIFFAESKDLVHWTRLGDASRFAQDERWYERDGRWDCIWTIPRPGGGYYGYWTATPKAETGGRFGFGETLDGVTWRALPPPQVTGAGDGEVGAIEKAGARYYMMFGTGGRMVTLTAEHPAGPFTAATKNPCLLDGHTYFARFFPTPGGLLVNHHSIARDGRVFFGTLKATTIDDEGTLRLTWWPGNEKLKWQAVETTALPQTAANASPIVMLEQRFDVACGLVVEGTLQLPATGDAPPAGLFIAHGNETGTAVLVRAGGITEIGPMRADGSGFSAEKRVDREWRFGDSVRFRLLLKGTLMEFYLDDLLMECYSLPGSAGGGIGLLHGGRADAFANLKAWRCEAPAKPD